MENKIIEMVVGFLFNPEMDKVVLIEKNRPDWQKGFMNGVGGKTEESDQDIYFTMKREFSEEAGLDINDWNNFCSIYGRTWKCYFFFSVSDKYNEVKTKTDEPVKIVNVKDLYDLPVIDNLRWLIPMCKDRAHKYCEAEVF